MLDLKIPLSAGEYVSHISMCFKDKVTRLFRHLSENRPKDAMKMGVYSKNCRLNCEVR